MKTAKEIDQLRKERGINKTTFSVSCGATSAAWGNGLRQETISNRFKRNALNVIEFYDEHGYVPMPNEIETETLGFEHKT